MNAVNDESRSSKGLIKSEPSLVTYVNSLEESKTIKVKDKHVETLEKSELIEVKEEK